MHILQKKSKHIFYDFELIWQIRIVQEFTDGYLFISQIFFYLTPLYTIFWLIFNEIVSIYKD